MRCAICDAKLPDNQPLHNDICSDCRHAIRQTFAYELDHEEPIECLHPSLDHY